MKQLIIFCGLSLFSTAAFSQQQVSNAKKINETPVPERINAPGELVSDSTAVYTMKRTTNQENSAVPISNETGSNNEQKPVLNSTLRKPD